MSDEAWRIAALREGDVDAFQQLLGPLVDPACRLAYSMLGDWHEAEDAVQEAAVRAWRAAPKLRADTSSFRPWFLTIVANQCRSRRRTRWFRTLRVAEPPTADLPDVADEVAAAADLAGALDRLDEPARLLLLLHFYLDLPLEESAAVLGISPAAAKTRLYRTIRALRPSVELESV